MAHRMKFSWREVLKFYRSLSHADQVRFLQSEYEREDSPIARRIRYQQERFMQAKRLEFLHLQNQMEFERFKRYVHNNKSSPEDILINAEICRKRIANRSCWTLEKLLRELKRLKKRDFTMRSLTKILSDSEKWIWLADCLEVQERPKGMGRDR
jgi:hypothetical protein